MGSAKRIWLSSNIIYFNLSDYIFLRFSQTVVVLNVGFQNDAHKLT